MGNLKDFVDAISANSYADAKDAILDVVSEKYNAKIDESLEKQGFLTEKKKKIKDPELDDVAAGGDEETEKVEGAVEVKTNRNVAPKKAVDDTNIERETPHHKKTYSGEVLGRLPYKKRDEDKEEKEEGDNEVKVSLRKSPTAVKVDAGPHLKKHKSGEILGRLGAKKRDEDNEERQSGKKEIKAVQTYKAKRVKGRNIDNEGKFDA